jgi:carbamoyl-phosphate synthase large subunit
MTLRVAITGIGGDVARGAIAGLRRNEEGGEPIWILGLGTGQRPADALQPDGFEPMPEVRDPGYVDALVEILKANKIDVLLPGIDSEIAVLSAARDRLAASSAHIVLAPSELVEAANDKLLTAEFLMRRGIGVPPTCDISRLVDLGFPIIAKPRQGHGSQGIATLTSAADLDGFLATKPENYCLQSYVGGPELTVGFLYDSIGNMRDAVAMERVLENGRTVWGRVVEHSDALTFIREFGARVRCVGPVNAQIRLDPHRGPMVFEINARLSGSTEMRVAVGCNDPLRLARHFGRGVPIAAATANKAVVRRTGTQLLVEP